MKISNLVGGDVVDVTSHSSEEWHSVLKKLKELNYTDFNNEDDTFEEYPVTRIYSSRSFLSSKKDYLALEKKYGKIINLTAKEFLNEAERF